MRTVWMVVMTMMMTTTSFRAAANSPGKLPDMAPVQYL